MPDPKQKTQEGVPLFPPTKRVDPSGIEEIGSLFRPGMTHPLDLGGRSGPRRR